MTATFADFCATADARNTIELNVRKWSLMLCDALEQDYIESSIKRQKFFAATSNREFHEQQIENIKNGDHYKFIVESGRKYHKIIMVTESGSRSVHAFVDKKTGELYKSASFKAPAKGMDRQHNRMVNEACDAWRQYDFKRLTVSRVPASEVA